MAFGASASPMSGQHNDLNIIAVHRKRTEEWVDYVRFEVCKASLSRATSLSELQARVDVRIACLDHVK